MRRFLARAGAVLVVATVAVFGVASPASAHITVDPQTATQGGFATLTFRVPNEEADASTVRHELEGCVHEWLTRLPDKQRMVIERRFGLDGRAPHWSHDVIGALDECALWARYGL